MRDEKPQTEDGRISISEYPSGQSELEFKRLLEKLPAGAYMCDPDGLITYYNRRAVELWGREPKLNDPVDRFCGSFKLFAMDGAPIRHDHCWMALALRNNVAYNGREIIIERPNGRRVTAAAYANPIRDESGKLHGAVNVLVDISDRKRAEDALRRARNELEQRVAERTAALTASNRMLQSEIVERKQAEEMARRQAAHAKALAQAASLLNAQLDLKTVLATVCRITANALAAPVVILYLLDEAKSVLEFASALGLPEELEPMVTSLPWSFYSQHREELGSVRSVVNLQNNHEWPAPDLVTTLHLQRALIVDLLRDGQVTGCVVLLLRERDPSFTTEDLKILQGLADQAAQAITNARLYEEVQARTSQMQQLSQRILRAEEEERKRLSRELHDSVGQLTAALLINISLLQKVLPADSEPIKTEVSIVRELAYKIHDELQSVSHTLRPPELEVLGLDAAVSELCHELSRHFQCSIEYHRVSVPPIPDAVTVAFYRFVQEALNNALKHASADLITVHLKCEENLLTAIVEDNGVGFNLSTNGHMADHRSVGLMSMRERLEIVGGKMDIESVPGRGTRLVASCPISQI